MQKRYLRRSISSHLVHEPRLAVVLSAARENLTTGLRHEESLFELRRPQSVGCDGGPVVVPGDVTPGAGRDHRLDGEGLSGLHDADGGVFGVVWNVGRRVEERVDAVSAVALHDAVPVLLHMLLDHVADLAVTLAGLDDVDGLAERLVRHLHQLLVLVLYVADEERLVEIAVKAAVVNGHVQVANVAVLQRTGVGDAVADDFVHRRAARLGEFVVVEWTRVTIALDGG